MIFFDSFTFDLVLLVMTPGMTDPDDNSVLCCGLLPPWLGFSSIISLTELPSVTKRKAPNQHLPYTLLPMQEDSGLGSDSLPFPLLPLIWPGREVERRACQLGKGLR